MVTSEIVFIGIEHFEQLICVYASLLYDIWTCLYGEIQQKRPVFRSPPTFVSKTCFCPTQIINRASLNDKICVKPQSNELHVFWRMYTVDEMIFGRR